MARTKFESSKLMIWHQFASSIRWNAFVMRAVLFQQETLDGWYRENDVISVYWISRASFYES